MTETVADCKIWFALGSGSTIAVWAVVMVYQVVRKALVASVAE